MKSRSKMSLAAALSGASILASVAAADARTITVATILNANDVSVQAMEKWNELLKERTGGGLELNIIPGGTLGGTRELVEQLSSGEIDVNLSSPVVLQYAAPKYQCLEAEYVYRDEDHGFAVWRGDVGKETSQAMKDNYNIEIAAIGRRGSRNVTSNRPIEKPSDLSGLKIRVTNDLRAKVFSEYGALPVPLPLSEVYGALRQGVVDAQENPLSTIHSLRFHEVQDYINETNHVWTYTIPFVNSDFYEGLGEHRRAFDETLNEAMDWLHDAVEEEDASIRKSIEESGEAKFIEPDVEAFREQARPVLEAYAAENCKPGLLDQIEAVQAAAQ